MESGIFVTPLLGISLWGMWRNGQDACSTFSGHSACAVAHSLQREHASAEFFAHAEASELRGGPASFWSAGIGMAGTRAAVSINLGQIGPGREGLSVALISAKRIQ